MPKGKRKVEEKTVREIVKEFDRVWFTSYHGSMKDGKYSTNAHRWVMSNLLKSLLSSYRSQILKEVREKMPKKQDFTKTLGNEFTSGYNSALKEIKRKLKEMETEK